MKANKIELNITYFILNLAIFFLNFNNFSLISILFGSILSILLIILFLKTKIIKNNIFKFIIFLLSIILSITYLNRLTYFISNNILRDYSTVIISLTLLISSYFLINKGYHTIVKVILLSSYFFLLVFIIGIMLSSFYFDINNLNINIFESNNLIIETFYYTFLMIYLYSIIYLPTNNQIKIKVLIINHLLNILLYIFIIGILSFTLLNIYEYSYIIIYKKISLINFLERIEIIFSFNLLFSFYYLFIFIHYQIKDKIIHIKKDKFKNLSFLIITVIIFLMSIIIF